MGMARAAAEMLPRLSAEESFQAMERVAIGTGSLKEDTSTQIMNGWRRDMTPEAEPTIPPKVRTPEMLRKLGVRVFSPTSDPPPT